MCVSDRMSSHFHSLSSCSLFLSATSIYVHFDTLHAYWRLPHIWRFEIDANYYFANLRSSLVIVLLVLDLIEVKHIWDVAWIWHISKHVSEPGKNSLLYFYPIKLALTVNLLNQCKHAVWVSKSKNPCGWVREGKPFRWEEKCIALVIMWLCLGTLRCRPLF